MTKMTLPALNRDFDADAECRQRLEELRWPNGVECPRCQSKKISCIKTRKQYDCDSCRYRFSVTVGTIFADSHLALPKWFLATFIICESKKGISALQLKRMLGCGYQTAWYLSHRIRAAMTDTNSEPLSRTVEVDETHVESVFSRFKRAIVGSFHQVSKKHLDRYLGEFEFRFNNRKNPYLFRDTLIRLLEAKTLPYEQLTA